MDSVCVRFALKMNKWQPVACSVIVMVIWLQCCLNINETKFCRE